LVTENLVVGSANAELAGGFGIALQEDAADESRVFERLRRKN
jgi:hypothetical protein